MIVKQLQDYSRVLGTVPSCYYCDSDVAANELAIRLEWDTIVELVHGVRLFIITSSCTLAILPRQPLQVINTLHR